jgi:hypothetical protein
MKTSLLATVAAAALIAGPALAQKQEAPASKSEAPARAPATMQNAPAEKSAPSMRSEGGGKSETTGQASPSGKSDMKASPNGKPMGADSRSDKPDTKASGDADKKSGTTGQASPSGKAPSEMKAGSDTKSGADRKTGTNADTKASGTDSKAPGTAQGQAKSGGSVALTTEQKTKIRSTVLTKNAPRVTNVNFSLNVGTVVPRTVRLVTVPPTLVEIHPAWRGFLYFVHEDEIVIVEPGTLKIVTIIEV